MDTQTLITLALAVYGAAGLVFAAAMARRLVCNLATLAQATVAVAVGFASFAGAVFWLFSR